MANRTGVEKAGLYMRCTSPAQMEILSQQAESVAKANANRLPSRVQQIVSARITSGMPKLPHEIVMAKSPAPFDVVYQLSSAEKADLPVVIDAIVAMAKALGDGFDRASSAVLVGQEIAITRGDGPIYNIMPLRRLPALSHEEFMHHWFDRHATLGEGVEGVRYRQNHVDYPATERLAAQTGLVFEPMDGLTESYFDSTAAVVELLSREEVAVGAIDDERLFIDHDRSQFGVNRIIWKQQS
jgi:hypothetical protein